MAGDRKRTRKDKISFLVNGRKGIGLLFRHKKKKSENSLWLDKTKL